MIEKILKNLIPLIIFIFLIFYYFSNLKTTYFFIDEYHFLRKSYYYDLFFLKRDFNSPYFLYLDEPLQPKIGPYLYGLAIHTSGVKDIKKYFNDIKFNEYNIENIWWWLKFSGKTLIPIDKIMSQITNTIFLGRRLSILFSLGIFILIYLLIKEVFDSFFASIAVFLFGINSLMLKNGTIATTDSILLFLCYFVLLLSKYFMKYLSNNSYRNLSLISVLIGAFSALVVGTKVSGIMIIIYLIVINVVLMIVNISNCKKIKTIIKSFIVIFITFIVTFILLHPYLYEHTLSRFVEMFTGRLEGTKLAQIEYANSAIYSRSEAFRIIMFDVFLPKGKYINFRFGNLPIDLFLFLYGLFLIIKKTINNLSKFKKPSVEAILVLWFFVVITCLIYYLRNNWSRYFLLTVSVVTILQTYAIKIIFRLIKSKSEKIINFFNN